MVNKPPGKSGLLTFPDSGSFWALLEDCESNGNLIENESNLIQNESNLIQNESDLIENESNLIATQKK